MHTCFCLVRYNVILILVSRVFYGPTNVIIWTLDKLRLPKLCINNYNFKFLDSKRVLEIQHNGEHTKRTGNSQNLLECSS